MTIFLTTQYMEEADELTERLAIIDHGHIVVEGSAEALKDELGGDSITITLAPQAGDGQLDAARNYLAGLSDVGDIQAFDQSLAVFVRDGGARLPEIVRGLDAAGVPVARFELAEPRLDDVFLRHTGDRLRVEEVKPPSRHALSRRRRQ